MSPFRPARIAATLCAAVLTAVPAGGAPTVPADLPTPAPGLDRALAQDYRKALEKQGIRVTALVIVDDRARGGVRRADIVYTTRTRGVLEALRPEVVRVLGPGANPRLALDQIVVRPSRADGAVIAAITVTVVDLDLWLKAHLSDQEFYRRWVVRHGR